jgi:hypothetical protein
VAPAKKKAAPAKKSKRGAPSKKRPRALANLYEGLHTKVPASPSPFLEPGEQLQRELEIA